MFPRRLDLEKMGVWTGSKHTEHAHACTWDHELVTEVATVVKLSQRHLDPRLCTVLYLVDLGVTILPIPGTVVLLITYFVHACTFVPQCIGKLAWTSSSLVHPCGCWGANSGHWLGGRCFYCLSCLLAPPSTILNDLPIPTHWHFTPLLRGS